MVESSLSVITSIGADHTGVLGATPAQIAAELDRKGYDLSEEDLTRALAHLQAKDILARSGPQSSLYRFKIDLIRRWIGVSRPAVAAAIVA